MALHLLEEQVTSHQDGHTSPSFHGITEGGFAKMSPAWLKQALGHSEDTTEILEERQQRNMQEDTVIDCVLHAVLCHSLSCVLRYLQVMSL